MQYIAFLRGIAPSGKNMQNDKLRGVFQKLEFDNVRSVISSGNVLFEFKKADIAKLEEKIEEAIESELGFKSTTIIRTKDQLEELIAANPFANYSDEPTTRFNVTFLKQPGSAPKVRLPFEHDSKASTVLSNIDGVICSLVDQTSQSSPQLMSWLEKTYGKEITTRTWRTVGRILNKF